MSVLITDIYISFEITIFFYGIDLSRVAGYTS